METPNAAEEAKLIDVYKQELAKLGQNTERIMRRHPWAALALPRSRAWSSACSSAAARSVPPWARYAVSPRPRRSPCSAC